jgi:hypothetical protein
VAYWLDADTFITAKNSLYAFEINSSLWAWFDVQLKAKTIRSPERVFREIMAFKRDDLLKQWVSPRRADGLCVEPDKHVSECLTKIANHLYTATVPHKKTKKPQPRYKPAQVEVFGHGADAFVIAHAMADRGCVVTFESDENPDSQRIRIPDVCAYFGIEYTNLKGLLFALGAKL